MVQSRERTELIELIQKPAAFRSWLDSVEPETIVGKRADEKSCPLANYIVQSGICGWARVHPDYLFIYSDENELVASVSTEEAGYWVERFVLAVDDKLRDDITVDIAKDLLESLINIEGLEKLSSSEYRKAVRTAQRNY